MKRVQSLLAWFSTTLGVTLLGVTVLIAPEQVFADTTSDCSAACCTGCFGGGTCDTLASCWTTCQGNCTVCAMMCGSDTTCQALCYTTARSGQCPDDPVSACVDSRSCKFGNDASICEPVKGVMSCTCPKP